MYSSESQRSDSMDSAALAGTPGHRLSMDSAALAGTPGHRLYRVQSLPEWRLQVPQSVT